MEKDIENMLMKDILFKAKRIDNGEWVEGNLILSDDAEEEWEAIIIPQTDSNLYTKGGTNRTIGFENWYRVNKDTICQYTGLTDKNGNEIWENDIVKIVAEDDEPYVIEWHEDTAKYVLAQCGSLMSDFDNYWASEIEIVGNKFDNPEFESE